jgi:hypothetical protein
MEVTTTPKSVKGPAQMFTGDVWFDVIAKGNDPSRLRANAVRFAPVPAPPGTATPSARPSTSPSASATSSHAAARSSRSTRATSSSTRLSARCLRWQRAW